MYKQIETTPVITLSDGAKSKPVATLANEYGTICQICRDDHCYVIKLKHKKDEPV